ncbi:hypothetical protein ACJZ2D_016033 [Fusarium nematophilum]
MNQNDRPSQVALALTSLCLAIFHQTAVIACCPRKPQHENHNLIAAACFLCEALVSALPPIPTAASTTPAAIEQLLKNPIVADPDSCPPSRIAAPALVETNVGGVRYGCKWYVGD